MMRCSWCGEEATYRCSRCKRDAYCCRGCQIEHWEGHRRTCDQHKLVRTLHTRCEQLFGHWFAASLLHLCFLRLLAYVMLALGRRRDVVKAQIAVMRRDRSEHVLVSTMIGQSFKIQFDPGEPAVALKTRISRHLAVHRSQVKFALGNQTLHLSHGRVDEHGISSESCLTAIVQPLRALHAAKLKHTRFDHVATSVVCMCVDEVSSHLYFASEEEKCIKRVHLEDGCHDTVFSHATYAPLRFAICSHRRLVVLASCDRDLVLFVFDTQHKEMRVVLNPVSRRSALTVAPMGQIVVAEIANDVFMLHRFSASLEFHNKIPLHEVQFGQSNIVSLLSLDTQGSDMLLCLSHGDIYRISADGRSTPVSVQIFRPTWPRVPILRDAVLDDCGSLYVLDQKGVKVFEKAVERIQNKCVSLDAFCFEAGHIPTTTTAIAVNAAGSRFYYAAGSRLYYASDGYLLWCAG